MIRKFIQKRKGLVVGALAIAASAMGYTVVAPGSGVNTNGDVSEALEGVTELCNSQLDIKESRIQVLEATNRQLEAKLADIALNDDGSFNDIQRYRAEATGLRIKLQEANDAYDALQEEMDAALASSDALCKGESHELPTCFTDFIKTNYPAALVKQLTAHHSGVCRFPEPLAD